MNTDAIPGESGAPTWAIDSHSDALINELIEQLAVFESAESAIAVYKYANWIINRLDEVKRKALELAELDINQRRVDGISTAAGSAGWTKPSTKQLDQMAWLTAVAHDPRLMEIQSAFDAAQAELRNAQEPYKALPEPTFYIR